MPFINETGASYVILTGLTNDVTGSLFISLLLIMVILLAIAMILKLPIESTAVFMIPFLLVVTAYYTEAWLSILGVFLLYLGVLIGKYFIFNK